MQIQLHVKDPTWYSLNRACYLYHVTYVGFGAKDIDFKFITLCFVYQILTQQNINTILR